MAGVNQDVWAAEMASKLFPDNSIIHHAKNDDSYASAEYVKLPIAGANPEVLLNNNTYTTASSSRRDSVLEYRVDKLSTTVQHITGLEELSLSTPKRQNMLDAHISALNTEATTYVLHKWMPNSQASNRVLRTLGSSRPASVKGATGNRKAITLESFFLAAGILDDEDIPSEGRIVFLPASMKGDLMRIDDVRKKESFGFETLPSGVVDRIMGFKVLYRSEAGVYDNASKPIPIDRLANPAANKNANAAALFFHPQFVRKAFYNVKVNIGQESPYLDGGEPFNAVMKIGASPAYPDFKGIVVLVEEHHA